jgi:hypothetical protein
LWPEVAAPIRNSVRRGWRSSKNLIASTALKVVFLGLAYWGGWLVALSVASEWKIVGPDGEPIDPSPLSLGMFLLGLTLLVVGFSPLFVQHLSKRTRILWFQFIGASAAAIGLVFLNGYASIVFNANEALSTAGDDLIIAALSFATVLACGLYLVVAEGVWPGRQTRD